jgi:hypothetical protein
VAPVIGDSISSQNVTRKQTSKIPVDSARSLPAKSTRLMIDVFVIPR